MAATKATSEAETAETAKAAAAETVKAAAAAVVESLYNVEELAEHASSVFSANIRSECVMAAFRQAGKATATVAQAKKIVNDFMKKEVK